MLEIEESKQEEEEPEESLLLKEMQQLDEEEAKDPQMTKGKSEPETSGDDIHLSLLKKLPTTNSVER